VLALAGVGAAPAAGAPPALERGPYLQLGTPTRMIVRWRTDRDSDSRLRYGPAPDQLDTAIDVPGSRSEHEIAITGLSPDTLYYYAVGTAAETLAGGDADHFFRTSPPAGTAKPFRIWVIGDSGTADANARAVRDAYLAFAGAEPADVWLMLGDNAYSDGLDSEYTSAVFETYPQILRNTVVWPSPGNHEFGASDSPTQSGPYYEAFTLPTAAEAGGVPSGTEAYYSFDYGNVHLIALDSHDTDRSVDGAMYAWLEADLQANDRDFTIVYWHHPPYSKGSHDSDDPDEDRLIDMRQNFVPLLEDYGVDLQLSGHSHSYERSMLIDGHYGPSSSFNSAHVVDAGDGDPLGDGSYRKDAVGPVPHLGAVYSVVGSSGNRSTGHPLDHPVMVRGIPYWGSLLIEIADGRLHAYWIDKDGLVEDEFAIDKTRACSDGRDNDGDGLVDAGDPGCTGPDDPSERDPGLACDDGLDNDGDGRSDVGADPGCDAASDPSELSPALVCDDGVDNDGDGLADVVLDPGCADPLDASELDPAVECDDGLDNDGDGLVDLADPGCSGVLDGSEQNPACSDGLDNDGDGRVDVGPDPGCDDALDASERDEDLACDDGLDNDGDGGIDLADADCADPLGRYEGIALESLVDQDFASGAGSFGYEDGAFGASSSGAADGHYTSSGGDAGGGLRVVLGPNGSDISGGWVRGFEVPPNALSVEIALSYRLLMDGSYDSGEYSEAWLAVDGVLIGVAPNDHLVRREGSSGNTDVDTGWRSHSFTLALAPGSHELAIGGYNNRSNSQKEVTEIRFDDVGIMLAVVDAHCSDGLDNDGDLRTDLGDPGCTDAFDPSESNPSGDCTDHVDNDGDGFVDFESDPGCADASDASERAAGVACDDGLDNDGDGLADLADPGCADPTGASENPPIAVSASVVASEDDAEERVVDGSVGLTSSDLELVEDGSAQVVGLRFRDLDVPQGAHIVSANLQLTVDETGSAATSLEIRAEASDAAAAFSTSPGDVTARPTTAAAVTWSPEPWTSAGASGAEQRSPDLGALLEEVVQRPGWTAGNAVALLVAGSGKRVAESFDGVASGAPRLEVVYLPEPGFPLLLLSGVGGLLLIGRRRIR
jgi:hypothetical protein